MSKIKFLPKKILQDLDLNQTYPKSHRHGNKAVISFFDDSKTFPFNESTTISLPTTAIDQQLNKLGGIGFRTDIEINGKLNQNAASYVLNLINNNNSQVEPFTEDNIPDSYFYEDGTKFLTSKIKDKETVKIKLPVPKNENFSGVGNKVEYLTLSPGISYDGITENAGWVKSEISLGSGDKNLNLKKAITDPLGNITNHNLTGSNSYNKFINEIHSQSFNRSKPDDNLTINLSDHINKPFIVEKISISFYGTPSSEWINSKTKLEYISGSYCLVGSTITAILAATNSGYYKTFFSGTISSISDTFVDQTELQIGESLNFESFPIGVDRWITPTQLLTSASLTKIVLEGPATFSNGAIQYKRSTSYNESITLEDGKIWSAKKIGRSNSGFNSGYSKFENEYTLPNSRIKSQMDDLSLLTVDYYHHIFNNYKSFESPCILQPKDNLVFTLSKFIKSQSDINNDSFIIGGNELEPIETDSGYEYQDLDQTNYITINLYGSYLKENKEIHDLFSQNIVTDCVHEIIGNDLITDTWECNPVNSLSGSIINNSKIQKSNFIGEFAELGINLNNYGVNELKWNRVNSYESNNTRILENKRLFELSSSSGIYDYQQGSILSSSFYELKNKLNYLQTYDNNEYYYDSLTPSLDDILKNQNKKIMNFKNSAPLSFYDGMLFISNDSVLTGLHSDVGVDSNFVLNNWQYKFPYDDEFSSCRRLFNENILNEKDNLSILKHNGNSSFYTNSTKRNLNTDLNLLICIVNDNDDLPILNVYSDFMVGKNRTSGVEGKFYSGLKYSDYKKVLFGTRGSNGLINKPLVKDNYNLPVYVSEQSTHYFSSEGLPYYPASNDYPRPQNLRMLICPIINGWKYGLYNGIETPTKMHWNMKRYGHFRDLLEQRHFTTFYYLSGKDSGVSNSAISVRFINPMTSTTIDPELTDSSNLNYDASSSRPYFDGQYLNRTYT